MSLWDVAAAAVTRAFRDPEPIIYTQGGIVLPEPIYAVRSDMRAPTFDNSSSSLRTITYEVAFTDLPARATKADSFTHRGRKWRIENVDAQDDVRAFVLTVGDNGPSA